MKKIPYGHQQIDSSDISEVVRTLKTDWITQGPKVKEFEDTLCKYTGAKYAVAVSSGTAALHIACLAAGIKQGDEVITSPITFVASANCVLYCGGKPVFADIQEETVNIDPNEVTRLVNKRTKAIIPVHFAGHPADMEEIHEIAKRNNLLVIEDAAHALGAEYRIKEKGSRIKEELNPYSLPPNPGNKWIRIGRLRHSDMAIFSFHPVKTITTGEGGAVLTNRKDLYEKLMMFRNHGTTKDPSRFAVRGPSTALGIVRGMVSLSNHSRLKGAWYYEQQYLGFNYRITDFQCALGISQLKKLDRFIYKRREIVQIYNKALSKIVRLELPVEREYVKSAWHLYVIRLRDKFNVDLKRKNIFNYLRKAGIGVQVHYMPTYLHPYYRHLGYKQRLCPKAESYYQRAISIPLYPSIKNKELKFVINTLRDAFDKHA